MDSKDVKEVFGHWSAIHMSATAKEELRENLRQHFKGEVTVKAKPHLLQALRVGSAATLFVGVLVLGGVLATHAVRNRSTQIGHPPSHPTPNIHYRAFVPPMGKDQAYNVVAAGGTLFIVGYGDKGTLDTETTTTYFREGNEAYLVAKEPSGKQVVIAHIVTPKSGPAFHAPNTIHIPLWFSVGKVHYAVIDNEYDGNHISIYQFTPSTGALGWNVRVVFRKTYQDWQLPYKVGNHLLIRSSAIGNLPSLYASFTKTGLQPMPIKDNWPKPGTLFNSTTLTLHESVMHQGGTTVVTLTGNRVALHVAVGKTLILRITGDHSIPIFSLFYADRGDPGDGSMATRLASPYLDAMLFRIVAKAQHGSVVFEPDNSKVRLKGISKITIASQ